MPVQKQNGQVQTPTVPNTLYKPFEMIFWQIYLGKANDNLHYAKKKIF